MIIVAHRGGAAFGAENSIDAIEASLAAGADGVEIDVRLSSDGTVVLMHDPDVARTTGGHGHVAEMTAAELRSLGVPAFEDVLGRVPPDRLLVVELKGHPWEAGHDPNEPLAQAVAVMLAAQAARRLVVSSFNPLALAVVRERAPSVPTAVLTSPAFDLASNLAAAVTGGHDECHVPVDLWDPRFVADAHAEGKRVVAWTVNLAEQVRRCARDGADGIICDDPVAARVALREQGE